MRTAGVYIHIPFCAKKCGFCDFNAYSGYRDAAKARYVEALCAEIARRAEPNARVPTIFFGGGTPTQLPADDLLRILDTVRTHFAVDTDAEITTEANPDDADPAFLRALHAGGFNRISFGVQTFDDALLRALGRLHTGRDAENAIASARSAGFDNISLDLMFALPNQTMAQWDASLDRAFALDIPHLSLYALILEEGTPFFARRARGKLSLPGEAMEAEMFARAMARAAEAGYLRYEVSNYARPAGDARFGYESRHNRIYWCNEEYFGFGAGAASYLDGGRSLNERSPTRYAERCLRGETATTSEERLDVRGAMGETLMLGLRMVEGVDLEAFRDRFGVGVQAAFPSELDRLQRDGLIEMSDNRMRLTPRGLFVGDAVAVAFL